MARCRVLIVCVPRVRVVVARVRALGGVLDRVQHGGSEAAQHEAEQNPKRGS
ncbi:MAG: hypothetical protein AAFX41_15430 [Bacteroidota bacterium]